MKKLLRNSKNVRRRANYLNKKREKQTKNKIMKLCIEVIENEAHRSGLTFTMAAQRAYLIFDGIKII
jgi:hypothetical protein